jgi:hypothetical protein
MSRQIAFVEAAVMTERRFRFFKRFSDVRQFRKDSLLKMPCKTELASFQGIVRNKFPIGSRENALN